MTPPDHPPVRPHLADRVHAALLKAGRPVTRGEIRQYYLTNSSQIRTADVQEALDTLVAEGLAVKGEDRVRWQRFDVYQAVSAEEKG